MLDEIRQMKIVPLTCELCDKFAQQASNALIGDGTCSLENIQTSCFASELCAKHRPLTMRLRNMLFCKHTFVALNDDTHTFVGCVTADLAASTLCTLFPGISHTSTSLLLSNLCVDKGLRRQGAGRMLVDAVTALSPDLFLLVQRAQPTHDTTFFSSQSRSEAKLKSWYASLGFDYVSSTPMYHLYKKNYHRPHSEQLRILDF